MVAAFPAKILLSLEAKGIEQKLKQVETLGQRIQQRADGIGARWAKIEKTIPTKEFGQVANKLRKVTSLSERVKSLTEARTKRLKGQSSLTTGLLKLNKATLEAARSEAEARGEAVAEQRALNNELKKTQQYSKPIGPKQAPGKGGGAGKGGGIGNLATGIGFPILFGGGLGSVLGGAAGSAGGFGPQILLSALGGIIDQYIAQLSKLGDSLSSATDVISGLEAAGYRVSASTEGVIASYQEAGLQAEAYEIAIAEINRVLGPNGAAKVSDYRVATEELADEYEKAKSALDAELLPAMTGTIRVITALTGAFNELSQSPIFKALAIGVGNLPGLKEASNIVGAAKAIGETSGNVVKPKEQRLLEEGTAIDEANKKQEAADRLVEAENKLSDASRDRKYIVDAQVAAAEAGVDIANDTVFAARKEVIERQYILDVQKAGTNEAAKKLALSEKELAILNLQNSQTSAVSKATKSAPKSKLLQLEGQILQEQIKSFDIETKRVKLEQGEEAALKRMISAAEERTNREAEILEKKREQALAANKVAGDEAAINAVYDQQYKNLLQRNRLDLDNNKQRLKTLEIEEKIAAVKGVRAVNDLSRDMNRQLEDISMQMANPFGGDELERLQLETQQYREYTDRVRQHKEAIADLQARQEADPTNKIIGIQIKTQEKLLATYKALSPAIQEAQMKQLQLNQTMQKLQPVTNAIASGFSDAITGVIDGTKTAEQAFSEMFANIGKAFVDMATEMIAKALVMKAVGAVTSMFGGGGGGGWNNPSDFNSIIQLPSYAGGGPTGNAPRTGGVDGRGGFPAILHPQETVVDHTGAMGRYSAGNATTAAASAPMTANVTYSGPTLNFNGDDYIPRSEANQLVAAGAKQGQARTLATLKNSRSQRSRLGM